MSNKIPASPAWCSYCVQCKEGPCGDHRGPDGKPQVYSGQDVYAPSAWVLEVVGQRYSAWDHGVSAGTRTWECFGYDPRHGFWMRTVDDMGPPRETNVSERAIDRTWQTLRMRHGSWMLLEAVAELGRVPNEAEAAERGIALDLAASTCRSFGLLTPSGQLSHRGERALRSTSEGDRPSDLRFLDSPGYPGCVTGAATVGAERT